MLLLFPFCWSWWRFTQPSSGMQSGPSPRAHVFPLWCPCSFPGTPAHRKGLEYWTLKPPGIFTLTLSPDNRFQWSNCWVFFSNVTLDQARKNSRQKTVDKKKREEKLVAIDHLYHPHLSCPQKTFLECSCLFWLHSSPLNQAGCPLDQQEWFLDPAPARALVLQIPSWRPTAQSLTWVQSYSAVVKQLQVLERDRLGGECWFCQVTSSYPSPLSEFCSWAVEWGCQPGNAGGRLGRAMCSQEALRTVLMEHCRGVTWSKSHWDPCQQCLCGLNIVIFCILVGRRESIHSGGCYKCKHKRGWFKTTGSYPLTAWRPEV